MFKLQSPSKYSPFDAIHLLRCFSTSQNSFWTHQFWCLLVLLPIFVSPLPHQQNAALRGQKKVTWGEMGWIGRVGHEGHAVLGKKLLNTQCGMGGCTHKSPIMKWAKALKASSKKNSLKLNTASHNNASWYTSTDGTLERSLRRGSLYYKRPTLQKILPVF